MSYIGLSIVLRASDCPAPTQKISRPSASGSWFRSSFHPWAWRQRSPESANRKTERNTKSWVYTIPIFPLVFSLISLLIYYLDLHIVSARRNCQVTLRLTSVLFVVKMVSQFLWPLMSRQSWFERGLHINAAFIIPTIPLVWPLNQLTATFFLPSKLSIHRKVQPHATSGRLDLDLLAPWPLGLLTYPHGVWFYHVLMMCSMSVSSVQEGNVTWHSMAQHGTAAPGLSCNGPGQRSCIASCATNATTGRPKCHCNWIGTTTFQPVQPASVPQKPCYWVCEWSIMQHKKT